jgi:hypothetical protein
MKDTWISAPFSLNIYWGVRCLEEQWKLKHVFYVHMGTDMYSSSLKIFEISKQWIQVAFIRTSITIDLLYQKTV